MQEESNLPEPVIGHLRDTAVKRRTIVKGAAWSVPVIAAAVAAPMSAASGEVKPCSNGGEVTFNDYPLASTPDVLTFKDSGGVPVASATLSWTQSTPELVVANKGMIWNGKDATIPEPGYWLTQMNGRWVDALNSHRIFKGDWVAVTFTFLDEAGKSVCLKDLTIHLSDIQFAVTNETIEPGYSGTLWSDEVYFNTPPSSVVPGALITGSGTSTDPIRSDTPQLWSYDLIKYPNPDLSATVQFSGPLSSLTLYYRAGVDSVHPEDQSMIIDQLKFAGCANC